MTEKQCQTCNLKVYNMFTIEKAWKTMLLMIAKFGHNHTKDDAKIKEEIGLHFKIKNPMSAHPFIKSDSDTFLKMVKEGAFDIEEYPIKGEALADYVGSIYDKDKILIHDFCPESLGDDEFYEPFVYTYPERLVALYCSNRQGEIDCINQMDVIVNRLKANVGSNRAIAVLYQAGLDSQQIDIPCLQLVQVLVRDNKLILSVFFRSNDIYGAWPSNMLFLSHLGLMIQDRLDEDYPIIEFDHIDYHVSSAHIYKTDLDAVKKIVNEIKNPFDKNLLRY